MGKWIHRLTDINELDGTGVCVKCGPVKVISRRTYHAPQCANAKAEQRGDVASDWRKRRREHGLNHYEVQEMIAGKRCALCDSTKRLVVDHCHVSGRIRGVLCDDCNVALGRFKDNVRVLIRAARYLKTGAQIGKPQNS
jgi:Autographiviridae endonuclease VII